MIFQQHAQNLKDDNCFCSRWNPPAMLTTTILICDANENPANNPAGNMFVHVILVPSVPLPRKELVLGSGARIRKTKNESLKKKH